MTYDRDRARTWVEVSRKNLLFNLRSIRKQVPDGAKLCVVVKADAYGHGAEFVARVAEEEGLADFFAVANLDEAERVRAAGVVAPILIMSHVPSEEVINLLAMDIRPTVSGFAEAVRFNQLAKKHDAVMKCHLKLDTGMARLGLSCREVDREDTVRQVQLMTELKNLEFEGVFSHFASASTDHDYQQLQYDRFCQTIDALKDVGITFDIRHIANSTTILYRPDMALDMVRAGIIVYGCYEDPENDAKVLPLKPVMHYQSRISEIRHLKAGETIGYGRTYACPRDSVIGVIEAGYSDGLMRSLSNKGYVKYKGVACPIVGRVCMDRSMIDITDVPDPEVGDLTHLFGAPPPNFISADEQADLAGTISYELFCDVNWRVPRIYVD